MWNSEWLQKKIKQFSTKNNLFECKYHDCTQSSKFVLVNISSELYDMPILTLHLKKSCIFAVIYLWIITKTQNRFC